LAGSQYLREQLDNFGDTKLALAAYNAGPTAVKRYKGIPPYPETERYIERVMILKARYEKAL
jgi:soluble lytic murein transglycosylase-like protein